MSSFTPLCKLLAALLLFVIIGKARTRSTGTYMAQCFQDEFECDVLGMRTCISSDWVCDHDNDCDDGSDEQNCLAQPHCSGDDFMCNNTECIPQGWVCDGEDDCEDGSDEDARCSATTTPPPIEDTMQGDQPRHLPHRFHHGHRHFHHARRHRFH